MHERYDVVVIGGRRGEVESYGGTVVAGRVTVVRREDDGFGVGRGGDAAVGARRLLLATGPIDELPDIPGVAERWGSAVLHCPCCHGWEVRDRAVGVGVVARGEVAALEASAAVRLPSGEVIERDAVVVTPVFSADADVLAGLGRTEATAREVTEQRSVAA